MLHNDRALTFLSVKEAFDAARAMDGTVNERLALFADALRVMNPDFAGRVDRLVERLLRAGAGHSAPSVGEAMPDFLLPDEEGHLVALGDVVSRGPAVLAFHRGHWCPYCQINAQALAEAQDALASSGGRVVAITPDRGAYAAALKASAGARFPMLSDIDNGYALSLNLAIWVGAEMQEAMSGFGVDLETYQGNPAWLLPIPATFVVGTDGLVTARFIDPDYRRRMNIDDLVEAVRAAR